MSKIGACGDDCDVCPRYNATKSGNIEELKKVKELWVRTGLRDDSIPAQELSCLGCKPHKYCGSRKLLDCVVTHHIENCGYCNSYPCEIVLESFNNSATWKLKIKDKCTEEEYEMLNKAFCMKKANLDKSKIK
jgi:hypothetical protein